MTSVKNVKDLFRKPLVGITLIGVVLMQAACAGPKMYSQNTSQAYIDPVCGNIVEATTDLKYEYEGRIYYFSSAECLAVFEQNPARFAREQNRQNGHIGMNTVGWWGPVLGIIIVTGMVAAMLIGVNH